jgi:hypothetical protein
MRQPKYQIGDVFFLHNQLDAKRLPEYNTFLFIPMVSIITKVTILRNKIEYTMKKFVRTNSGVVTAEAVTEDERWLDKLARSQHDKMERITNQLISAYDELIKELNKEKLSEVLHG